MRRAWIGGFLLCLVAPIGQGCPSRTLRTDTLVVGLEGSPTRLDPRLATDAYSAQVDSLVFNGLTRVDGQGAVVGDLAERWSAPSATEYVFRLREGARFQDGRPVTAADVVSTLQAVRDPALQSPYASNFEEVERIEALDPRTVRIDLRQPFAPLLVALRLGILPGGRYDPSRPIGTGPYRIVRFVPDEEVALEAYPGSFSGAPHLRRVVFRILPNDSTRVMELERGGVDLLVNNVPPDLLPRLEADPALKVLHEPGTSYSYLGMNLDDPILRHRRVREAIALAIDRDEIIRRLLGGLARPAWGLLAPEHWAAASDLERYPYDPARARALLDQAGFPVPPGTPVPPRFTLVYKTSENRLRQRIGAVIAGMLEAVGIRVLRRSFEWGTFYADIRSGNFQLYTLTWVGVVEPDLLYNVFSSDSFPPRGSNRDHYANPRVDRLLEAARRTLDRSRRKALYVQAQRILAHDLPYVSLWWTDNVAVERKNLQGFRFAPDGSLESLKDARFLP